jgi:hypothetical protein
MRGNCSRPINIEGCSDGDKESVSIVKVNEKEEDINFFYIYVINNN